MDKFEKLKQAVEALYYGAYWASDRLDYQQENKLWESVRDAAELEPGQTGKRLGAPRFV